MKTPGRAAASTCNAPLYRFVFRGRLSFTTVFLLCVAFVMSGFHLALASEMPAEETGTESVATFENFTEKTEAETELDVTEPDAADQPPSLEVSEPTATPVEAEVSETVDEDVSPVVTDELQTEPEVEVPTESIDTEATGTAPVVTEVESMPTEEEPPTNSDTDPESEIASSTTEVVDESTVTTESVESSTTTDATSSPLQVGVVTNAENYYHFSREECVRVDDGSYYCGGIEEKEAAIMEDGLFAAPDSDGDLEIFLRFDGVESKVTSNTLDDAAPYYDASSNSIVWHRLINDRYQIVSYDIEKAEEKLLTSSGNNMEPSRFGELTAWQSWVDDNWEIVLFDGKEQRVLTQSPQHDVAPLVYESYVLWNTTALSGEQQIAMYDLERNDTTLIKDEDGASVRNPRMVLVYETANDHGDVMTKGFDLASRTVVPLSATPKEIPTEIPESDQTGETRALIQNKSTAKESELLETAPEPEPVSSSTPNTPTVATSSLGTSANPATSSAAVVIVASTTPEAVTDVVVGAYEPATTSPVLIDPATVIEDVVVPPFSATSTN